MMIAVILQAQGLSGFGENVLLVSTEERDQRTMRIQS